MTTEQMLRLKATVAALNKEEARLALRITSAKIVPCTSDKGNKSMAVTLSDGTEDIAFSFFSDEVRFHPSEVIGRSLQKAIDMADRRNLANIRA